MTNQPDIPFHSRLRKFNFEQFGITRPYFDFNEYHLRFRSNPELLLDEMLNNYIYFAKRSELNDPFDCSSNLVKMTEEKEAIEYFALNNIRKEEFKWPKGLDFNSTIQKWINEDHESIRNLMRYRLQTLFENVGIASFFKNDNSVKGPEKTNIVANMQLWAYYGGNHKGAILGFKISEDEFFNEIKPVQYLHKFEKQVLNPSSKEDFLQAMGYIIWTKSSAWKNENEHRLIKPIYESQKLKYKPESLGFAILGCNFPSTEQELVEFYKKIKENNPSFKLLCSVPLPDSFGIGMLELVLK